MTHTALRTDATEHDRPEFALRQKVGNSTVANTEPSFDFGTSTSRSADGRPRWSHVDKTNRIGGGMGSESASPAVARERIREMVGVAVQSTVRVDVVDVEVDVARCEIQNFGGQTVSVALPLDLFPQDATPGFGRSYDMEVIVENGIKRPVLRLRPPNQSAMRAQKDHLQSLVARIAGR